MIFVIVVDHYGSQVLDWYKDETIVDSQYLSPYLQIFFALVMKLKRLFPYPPLSYQIMQDKDKVMENQYGV